MRRINLPIFSFNDLVDCFSFVLLGSFLCRAYLRLLCASRSASVNCGKNCIENNSVVN